MTSRNYLLLTPGPLTTSRTVKEAMLFDSCTWDDDYNIGVVESIRQQLTALATAADGYTSVLLQGSGSYAVEAVLAAVFLDGGLEHDRDIIQRFLLDRMEQVNRASRDHKTYLQELVQRKSGQVLSYELIGESGPDHNKTFQMQVLLNGQPIGQGTGHSKKEAEQAAANAGIERLEGK